MSRYLTVTCSAPKCEASGRVKLFGLKAEDLPAGWLIVSYAYDQTGMEFCSWACVVAYAAAMQKAHESQREWQAKPLPRSPANQPPPEGALL